MRRNILGVCAASLGLFLSVAPALAHHSFAAEYDRSKAVTLTGRVTKVEWMNPHVYFYMDVADDKDGKVTNWAFEMGNPAGLYRNGWKKEALVIGGTATVGGWLAKDGKPHANTFLRLLWPSIESHFAGASIAPTPAVNVVAVVDSAIRTRRLPLAWKLPEPIEPVGKSELRDIVADEPLRPDFEWVGETARHVGTLVHRELERMARLSLGADGIHLEARYEIELAELGVPPHLRASAGARVIQALTQMLSDERGRWLLANSEHREAASELALSGVIDGSIVNGVIDRTFVTQEGVRWIVDFKTSTHAGGGREEFLSNEVERYRKQLQRYAALMRAYRPGGSIKAALYFPLLAAWREVAV